MIWLDRVGYEPNEAKFITTVTTINRHSPVVIILF